MNHEPTRWSRTARPLGTRPTNRSVPTDRSSLTGRSSMDAAACPPEEMHLVSQGFPVRIRRALVAGGLALALALGGSVAASLTGAGTAPSSAPSDTVVTGQVSLDG